MKKAKWKLSLSLEEAKRNEEVISLASSQVLRWIDEINGIVDADERAKELKRRIKKLRRENTAENRKEIRKLYRELDSLQFKPDYMCLVVNKVSDYRRACKGFQINGVKYKRLLGTPGGIKLSTVVFVSEKVYDTLFAKIDNGRDLSKKFVPAKLEAYKALTCSASIPVSMPKGILVVNDLETTFTDTLVDLTNEDTVEPEMSPITKREVTITPSDGCGMMLPALAERWSQELGLKYVMGGCCTRLSFEKGMVFTFPFDEFAEEVAGKYIVKDAWGHDVDIRNVEIILPVSMLKLWDSYDSIEHYVSCCEKNGYHFGITKVCPEVLESERRTNYQFIQSFELDTTDIEEFIAPTMNEIHDVLVGDWRRTVLFLKGVGMSEQSAKSIEDDFAKAIMIDNRVMDDPYVRTSIYRRIRNRINEAKIGVLNIHGNYSVASGDLYALCQNIFGLQVTGLLKANEVWNGYWANQQADELLCFRAPMSCHENIRRVYPARRDDVRRWFRYMQTCTVFSPWSNEQAALNGMDFDGDLVMLTDNPVLLRKHKILPTLCCGQRSSTKIVPTEEQLIESNIASFGNAVGQITNRVTAMYEVQSRFVKGSREYEELAYRIRCGQQYQQDSIDKAKGIISTPMPRGWYDRRSVAEDCENKELYTTIAAERKPYFMRYIYPNLMREYNTFIKTANRNSLMEFNKTLEELLATDKEDMTEREQEFVHYYHLKLPVGAGDCVMNRICRRFEEEFDGYIGKHSPECPFDYSILKNDSEYSKSQVGAIRSLITSYNNKVKSFEAFSKYERLDDDDYYEGLSLIDEEFASSCDKVCPDSDVLCNIAIDICYSTHVGKRFVWKFSSPSIIKTLLNNNGGVINIPVLDENGDVEYAGKRFSVKRVCVEGDNNDLSE